MALKWCLALSLILHLIGLKMSSLLLVSHTHTLGIRNRATASIPSGSIELLVVSDSPKAQSSDPAEKKVRVKPESQAKSQLRSESSTRTTGLKLPLSVQYPYLSRVKGEAGKVELRIKILQSGEIQNLKVLKSSGFLRLDEAAVKSVQALSLGPQSQSFEETIEIEFVLRE